MEDIKKLDAAQEAVEEKAENKAENKANVTDSDTGKYTHEFKKPYTYEEKTYTKLEFDFEKLIDDVHDLFVRDNVHQVDRLGGKVEEVNTVLNFSKQFSDAVCINLRSVFLGS